MTAQEESTKDKGNALEDNVEYIFMSAGFETKRNVFIAQYEIDVLAEIGDRSIIVECKNYQSSYLTIRNLIHEWKSKNEIIKASKVIIMIAGQKYQQSDYQLADEYNIELWDEDILTELFNVSLRPQELRQLLISKIDLSPQTIRDRYRDKMTELVINPMLGHGALDEETLFAKLNNWLRAFIRTELQISGTTKEDRLRHIELFEGTKTKKVFFNLFTKDITELEYWDKLKERLTNEKVLSPEIQTKYLTLMNDLYSEYTDQIEFYKTKDIFTKTRRLIHERLYISLMTKNQICRFGFRNGDNNINLEVKPTSNEKFAITIWKITKRQANIINWMLTSEYRLSTREYEGKTVNAFSWDCFSLDDATEKTYVILDEFIGIDEKSTLWDFAL